MNGPVVPTAQEILRVTEEVLQRPEFHSAARSAGQQLNFLERFLIWLASRGPLRIGSAAPIVLKVLFILLLVALVAYLLRLLLSGSERWAAATGRIRRTETGDAEGSAVEGGLSGSLEEAELAMKKGDLRTAIRILYRRLIERLAEGGLLNTALWKTSLTYLRECPQDADPFPLLQQTVQAYNAIVYGHLAYDGRIIARLLSELRSRDAKR